mgnify:CR=1 FL=1
MSTLQSIYQQAEFMLASPDMQHCPSPEGVEIAFAGRSNAGKSSAINALTGRKSLARTSKTPGRTREMVFFRLDDQRRLVDLPGYGYAKVPVAMKQKWQQHLSDYLQNRECLAGLLMMMDVRHPLTEYDWQMLDWCRHVELPVHILLTKADKLKRGPASASLLKVRKQLKNEEFDQVSVQLFSALKRTGVDQAHVQMAQWLNIEKPDVE